jgi:hemerythrin-like domain-containing protein
MGRITDAIKKDHRELEEYYEKIVNSVDEDEMTAYQNQFTWELARHSIGEELVVYPAFEKNVPNGKEMAEKDRSEHQTVRGDIHQGSWVTLTRRSQVKEKLKEFQGLRPSNGEFLPTIKSLMHDLSAHIKEEEDSHLPLLENNLSVDESESMSRTFGRTKMFVPSRSHPSAPDKPPFETAVGLLTAPIDHIADIFRKWPGHTVNPNPSTE